MHVLELAAFAQYSNAEEKLVSASRMAGLLRRHAQGQWAEAAWLSFAWIGSKAHTISCPFTELNQDLGTRSLLILCGHYLCLAGSLLVVPQIVDQAIWERTASLDVGALLLTSEPFALEGWRHESGQLGWRRWANKQPRHMHGEQLWKLVQMFVAVLTVPGGLCCSFPSLWPSVEHRDWRS